MDCVLYEFPHSNCRGADESNTRGSCHIADDSTSVFAVIYIAAAERIFDILLPVADEAERSFLHFDSKRRGYQRCADSDSAAYF